MDQSVPSTEAVPDINQRGLFMIAELPLKQTERDSERKLRSQKL